MSIILDAAQVAARLSDLPAEMPALQILVLAGSVAKGRATPSSDVDLGILCESKGQGDDGFDFDALFLAIAPRLQTDRLDLIDLRRASPLLAFEIARTGHLLFERRPGLFRQFQSLSHLRYCDTEMLRQATKERIHRFLEREGLR